jgi:hypothetical protein
MAIELSARSAPAKHCRVRLYTDTATCRAKDYWRGLSHIRRGRKSFSRSRRCSRRLRSRRGRPRLWPRGQTRRLQEALPNCDAQRPPLLKISSAFHHCLGYVPFLSLWLAAHTPCAVHYILGALFEEAFSAALHKHCHSAARLALASSTTLLRSAHRILVEKPCLVVRVVQEGTGRARRRCRRCRAGWGCRGRRGLWRWHRRGLARRRALPVNHPVASFQIPRDVRSRGKSSHKQPRPVGSG